MGTPPKSVPETERFQNGIVSGLVASVHLDVEPKRKKLSCKCTSPMDRFYVSVIGDVANRGDVESTTVTHHSDGHAAHCCSVTSSGTSMLTTVPEVCCVSSCRGTKPPGGQHAASQLPASPCMSPTSMLAPSILVLPRAAMHARFLSLLTKGLHMPM